MEPKPQRSAAVTKLLCIVEFVLIALAAVVGWLTHSLFAALVLLIVAGIVGYVSFGRTVGNPKDLRPRANQPIDVEAVKQYRIDHPGASIIDGVNATTPPSEPDAPETAER